jgi:hypothetical protein
MFGISTLSVTAVIITHAQTHNTCETGIMFSNTTVRMRVALPSRPSTCGDFSWRDHNTASIAKALNDRLDDGDNKYV